MNDESDQLQSFKQAYAGLKYPGDLSADVPLDVAVETLSATRWPWWLAGAAGVAAAVAIAVGVWVMNVRQEQVGPGLIAVVPDRTDLPKLILPDDVDESVDTQVDVPSFYAMDVPRWGDVEHAVPAAAEPASFSLPTLSDLHDAIDQQETELESQITIEENV